MDVRISYHKIITPLSDYHLILWYSGPRGKQNNILYKWIYWRVEYLAICLKNSVGVILIWRNVTNWEIN